MTSRPLLPLGAALSVLAIFVLVSLLLSDRAGVMAAPALDAGDRGTQSGLPDSPSYADRTPTLATETDGRQGISSAAPAAEQDLTPGPHGRVLTMAGEGIQRRARKAARVTLQCARAAGSAGWGLGLGAA